jgi:hypothetical protein
MNITENTKFLDSEVRREIHGINEMIEEVIEIANRVICGPNRSELPN